MRSIQRKERRFGKKIDYQFNVNYYRRPKKKFRTTQAKEMYRLYQIILDSGRKRTFKTKS